jgi:beta-phosphoglucomutase family hydrolase
LRPDVSQLGVLFDWDGVIIDSSFHHEAAWERLAAEEKRPLPQGHFKRGFGMKNERIIPHVLGWTDEPATVQRFSLRKEELYRAVVRERGIEPLPGVREFLDRLRAADVPFAIGSSTHRLNIDTILAVIGLNGWFTAIISADDVKAGKPNPDVFLRGAERIQRRPDHCVVFEDALVGVEAARAGCMKAVGVASTHPADSLRDKVDRVVVRLDELSVADLLNLWK